MDQAKIVVHRDARARDRRRSVAFERLDGAKDRSTAYLW
jgi:hypothetical protein